MADVRAMLRSELASRKAPSDTSSKKRKAATHDRSEESKKARGDNGVEEDHLSTDVQLKATENPSLGPDEIAEIEEPSNKPRDQDEATVTNIHGTEAVDEDEWAAFERDVATPPPTSPESQRISAINAPATIQAKPLGAAELAAQAREAESTQRGQKEVEIDDEREEAEARLLDQFEEMDALEERVRKLREKREAIRRGSKAQSDQESHPPPEMMAEQLEAAVEGSGTEDDDDNEEWDVWNV